VVCGVYRAQSHPAVIQNTPFEQEAFTAFLEKRKPDFPDN
jgi:hypothetical protein